MESILDHRSARALLEWQIALGADECIQDVPVDRYALPDAAPVTVRKAAVVPQAAAERSTSPVLSLASMLRTKGIKASWLP
jgi:DNA polymerase